MTPTCDRCVLVVDDDDDVRTALAEVLADLSFVPQEASNGDEALRQLLDGAPEPCVILLDLMMPVMDGYEFRARQAADAKLSRIPVVVLTAHANVGAEAERLKAAAVLRKPVSLEQLQEVVERLCPEAPAA